MYVYLLTMPMNKRYIKQKIHELIETQNRKYRDPQITSDYKVDNTTNLNL